MALLASDNTTARSDDAPQDCKWWERGLSRHDAHRRLFAAITKIETLQKRRGLEDLVHRRLYGNAPVTGLGVSTTMVPPRAGSGRVGLNVVKNCSDAFVAKICKDQPKVSFVTQGGDWDLQQRARAMEKFVDGQFYELRVHDLLPLAILDSCIYGTGVLHPYRQGDGSEERLGLMRVPKWALRIDEQEGLFNDPRSFYWEMFFDREVLLNSYEWDEPAKEAIKKAKLTNTDVSKYGYSSTSDQVRVWKCWRLPSRVGMSETETDGRYAIALNEAPLLYSEPYTYDEPPFIFFRRQMPPDGFWGTGLAEELRGLQLELNTLMQKIQRSFHLLGSGHWIVEKNSRVNKHKIDNDPGSIIEYVGTAPILEAANPVPEQIFAHMDRIYQRCYEITGISQLEAQSQKPKGLNSGKAIDSYLDITTERFNVAVRLMHSAVLRLADWILRLSSEVCEENESFCVMSSDQHDAHPIKFSENELRKDQYVLKMWPTNALADDPAEKMDQVEKMAGAGWVDPQTARRLLEYPDLEAAQTVEDASYDNVQKQIARMLKDGVYKGPQPYLDLGIVGPDGDVIPGQAMKQVQTALIKADSQNAPEAKLKLLKDWLADAREEVLRSKPSPVMSPAAQPGSPGVPPPLAGQPIAPMVPPGAGAGPVAPPTPPPIPAAA